jgi:hypothetical protein
MRRLAFATAVCSTLVLAACNDQTRPPTEPSVPPPAENFGTTCSHGRYPLKAVAALIPAAFPASAFPTTYKALRAEALLRVGAVAVAWDLCRDRVARQVALKAIVWIDSKVTSPAAEALKTAILNGLGGGASTTGVDYIAGVWKPGETKVFTTPSGRATMEVRPGAFSEATLFTIRRLPDNFRLNGFPADRQDAPFWDYDATNSHTDNTVATHTLLTAGTVTTAFCFNFMSDGEGGQVQVTYPYPGARMGHNPIGGGPPVFEFVEETELPANLAAELHACSPPSDVINLRNGTPGANFTWANAGHYLARLARALLLPTPLRAATVVGPLGPLAGKPVNFSPFGIVLPDCQDQYGSYTIFCLDQGGGID